MGGPTLFDVSLFTVSAIPELDVRGDDHVFTSCLTFFDLHRNDGKVYATLFKLATEEGKDNGDGTRTIRVGYKKLRNASGCSTRAMGRAWPRLLDLGFLKSREPHKDRRAARYVVCSISCLDSIYKDAGCTHFRISPDRKIQPFRQKSSGAQ